MVKHGGRHFGRGTVSLEMFAWLHLINQVTGVGNSVGHAVLVHKKITNFLIFISQMTRTAIKRQLRMKDQRPN